MVESLLEADALGGALGSRELTPTALPSGSAVAADEDVAQRGGGGHAILDITR